jgi:hypothetical protein
MHAIHPQERETAQVYKSLKNTPTADKKPPAKQTEVLILY